MALVCVKCKMFCAIYLIIFTISTVNSAQDIYFETHSAPGKTIHYYLYNTDHSIQKRDALSSPSDTGGNKSLPPSTSSTSEAPSPTNATSTVTEVVNDSKIVLNKNLGINGTGRRKNMTKDVPVGTLPLNLTTVVPTQMPNVSEIISGPDKVFDADDDLYPPNFFDDTMYNNTMTENNLTKTITDTHQFYNSTTSMDPTVGHSYWVNMSNAKISDLLSQSHRRAATVRLSFEFPFYGHLIRNITIATGGFLYTGDYVHSWLAATQYIAPLMANFDTSLSNDSFIKFQDNGTAFTVQWEMVALQDKPDGGNFTFQTTLFKNGDIVFVYENIPFSIEYIQDDHHPVKVGLSDAYISDKTIFFVRRKTIYEYHRVMFNHGDIKNWTSIYLTALPTCLSNKDCVSCVTKPPGDFKCMWCPGTNRCSNGMDRNRQGWLSRGCERKKIQDEALCATASDSDLEPGVDINNNTLDGSLPHYNTADHTDSPVDQPVQQPRTTSEKPVSMGVSSIVTILFLISLVVGMGVWVMYAYRNPHSTSGQILIRYRPSQWSWKRGEARYTAATIHM